MNTEDTRLLEIQTMKTMNKNDSTYEKNLIINTEPEVRKRKFILVHKKRQGFERSLERQYSQFHTFLI